MRGCNLIFVGLILSVPANAHHSFAAFYDMTELTEIEGEVTSVVWKNPHITFTMDVPGSDGSVTSWQMAAGSVNTLERFGIGEDIIRVGATLRVAGPRSRHGLDGMFVVSIFPPGGEVVLNPNIAARLPSSDRGRCRRRSRWMMTSSPTQRLRRAVSSASGPPDRDPKPAATNTSGR